MLPTDGITSPFENQASRRAVDEQATLAVGDASFGGPHATTPAKHNAFCRNRAGVGGDGPNERNLEFERSLADAFFEGRQDCQPHAAVEQRGRETAVDSASRVEMGVVWLRSDYDTPALRLRDFIVQRLGDRVEGQRPVNQTLDEFQTCHLFLSVGGNGPVGLAGDAARHRFLSAEQKKCSDSLSFAPHYRSPNSDFISSRYSSDPAISRAAS